jgi:hypothetical protein
MSLPFTCTAKIDRSRTGEYTTIHQFTFRWVGLGYAVEPWGGWRYEHRD